MDYKKDIDGLRAISVLIVILYHAGFTLFKGGFLGVDVFFVISGYLITFISLNEKEKNVFSVSHFYEKRIRRLFPTLIAVLFITYILAYIYVLPYDFKFFSQSLSSSVLFVSNLFFFLKSGYFDISNNLKPLIHTWSLSLEEQFYILFPFLILYLDKKYLKVVLLFSMVLSFAFCFWGRVLVSSDFMFYMLPSRLWQLVAGALLAEAHFQKKSLLKFTKLKSLFGLMTILASCFFYNFSYTQPGLYTLIPVLGTLIILNNTFYNKTDEILGNKYLVKMGHLSYSLYLVHQPVLVFYRIILGHELGNFHLLGAIIVSFLFSYLIHLFIENRFRKITFLKNKTSFGLIFISLSLLCFLGFMGHLNNGFIDRTISFRPNHFFKVFEPTTVEKSLLKKCESDIKCLYKSANKESILLIGDSHSQDFVMPFADFLQTRDFNGFILVNGGCSLAIDPQSNLCKDTLLKLKELTNSFKIDRVIYIENFEEHALSYQITDMDLENKISKFVENFDQKTKVFLFKPRFSFLESIETWGTSPFVDLDKSPVQKVRYNSNWENKYIKLAESSTHLFIFDENRELCKLSNDLSCSVIENNTLLPLYRDSNHLTPYAARKVFKIFMEAFNI